jgi:hypothetical protein
MFAHKLEPCPSSQRALAHMAKTLSFHNNIECLLLLSHFKCNLIISGKAGAYQSRTLTRLNSCLAPSLAHEYKTRVEEIEGDKKSSLLGQNIAMKSYIVPAQALMLHNIYFFRN